MIAQNWTIHKPIFVNSFFASRTFAFNAALSTGESKGGSDDEEEAASVNADLSVKEFFSVFEVLI